MLRPLNEAINVIGANRLHPRYILKVFLKEMHRRRTSLWAWTQEDWIEIFATDKRAFRERHGEPFVSRQQVVAVCYLLTGFTAFQAIGMTYHGRLALKVFDRETLSTAFQRVRDQLTSWGYKENWVEEFLPPVIGEALLANRSPYLEDLSLELLEELRQRTTSTRVRGCLYTLSRALAHFHIVARPLPPTCNIGDLLRTPPAPEGPLADWEHWWQRWRNTSTLSPTTRRSVYCQLLKVGRWLAELHPEVRAPEQWTRELAAEFVAAVERMTAGQWARTGRVRPERIGTPLAPRSKEAILNAVRTFFLNCQEWNWTPPRFDPRRSLRTPLSIRSLIGPSPRVIADDIWAKLLWAGLNLTDDDLPHTHQAGPLYPPPMVRAMVVVWLFAGLRSDEIYRLRVGCVRWQEKELVIAGTDQKIGKDTLCWLDIPVNKTNTAFTKPVDFVVGEAIMTWERVRPRQPAMVDQKTGEVVHYLFCHRGRRVGKAYINDTLIPLLCRKAGVPESDARGNITSHRARSTIATQLFNADEPMSLFELQEWLGHSSPSSTQHYAKIKPTKLAKSYADAGYFERNVRTIKALIDRDAVLSGAAAAGQPWEYFDLGHGYCTNSFFVTCQHRMACAKCDFYLPKGSSKAQMLEAKTNLQQMLHQIPLTDDERAAVEEGIEFMEKLCEKLADVPTPAGPTPRELDIGGRRELPVLTAVIED